MLLPRIKILTLKKTIFFIYKYDNLNNIYNNLIDNLDINVIDK